MHPLDPDPSVPDACIRNVKELAVLPRRERRRRMRIGSSSRGLKQTAATWRGGRARLGQLPSATRACMRACWGRPKRHEGHSDRDVDPDGGATQASCRAIEGSQGLLDSGEKNETDRGCRCGCSSLVHDER